MQMPLKSLIAAILLFFTSFGLSFAQKFDSNENTFETNWSMSFQVGRTALLGELNTDFSGWSNDMNNMSDWGINLQFGKMIWERFDAGVEFGFSKYKGFKNYSGNVNYLNLHSFYNNEHKQFEPHPIYYDSDLINFTFFIKYNFINFKSISRSYLKLNMYLKMGIGLAFPSAELGYNAPEHYESTGLSHPLYLKGRYPNHGRDAHNFFCPAVGLNYQINDRLFFSAETSFQLIGADNIDGVHNYSKTLTPDLDYGESQQHRIRVYDVTAKFLLGATYYFHFDSTKDLRDKQTPWFKRRFRSYFSRFHNDK
jgi:hypothetical protein